VDLERKMSLPILPTTVVGSHGKAGWWFEGVKAHEEGRWGSYDINELLDDAANVAIKDMTDAGIDVITDGEVRRLDGYVDSYYAVIKGIQPVDVPRKAGPWGYDQQQRYRAVGTIDVPDTGLGIIEEFRYLKAHTDKPVKATCAGPLTFGSRIHPGNVYADQYEVAERFAKVINAELKGLVEIGADWIQIDEPARGHGSGELMARMFNLAIEGVKAKIGYHICFGNRFGRARFKRHYRDYFPQIMSAKCDQFVLEFAGREMYEIDRWKDWDDGRELGVGVIDVKSFHIETAEDVAERVREALKYVKPEKLVLNPDCGFGWSPRNMCNGKLRALAEGAALVRKEIG
jgi:5-methyltetrahydropteroyltriglutamate--homocysteine methyltransferase